MESLRYPIGVQSFEKIREGGYVYVDKTEYIHRLICEGGYYFLSRPRRFGKSLLLSTMEAYFKGKRELFKGLAIDSLTEDWTEHPVLHLDLNAMDYTDDDNALKMILQKHLSLWEEIYSITPQFDDVALRFETVVRTACKATGRQVVVLIDEYDKPLLQNLFNKERQDRFRNTLKAFYGVLKSCDQYLRFAFLTGVTKFGRVSVFSDLNNLRDISLLHAYNGICGISETELADNFSNRIKELAEANGMTVEETNAELKENYDGYHFSNKESEGIYNPFSLMNVMQDLEFKSYWFSTGTPTLLVKLLQRADSDLDDVSHAERSELDLMGLDPAFRDPVPVIFQSGYLTIKGYDRADDLYRLGFPNKEIEKGFLNFILPFYVGTDVSKQDLQISRFVKTLNNGDVDSFMEILSSFMAGIPYEHSGSKISEGRFHDVVFIIASLMNYSVSTEYRTNRGRIDLLIKTKNYIYIMEFKTDATPEEALRQIEEKGYAEQFLTDRRQIVKVGVEFSTDLRNIRSWKTAE